VDLAVKQLFAERTNPSHNKEAGMGRIVKHEDHGAYTVRLSVTYVTFTSSSSVASKINRSLTYGDLKYSEDDLLVPRNKLKNVKRLLQNIRKMRTDSQGISAKEGKFDSMELSTAGTYSVANTAPHGILSGASLQPLLNFIARELDVTAR
jgi:hypothetical protein